MSMSIPVSSQPKKLFHTRNGSDELDVFEAAHYFSGAIENSSDTRKTMNHNTRPFGRMSLDMPNPRGDSIPLQAMVMENKMMNKKEKKFKQPSSPGGKLAQFLNSLFNQTSSKKSKSKLKSTKNEDESPTSWRRKRRSSISHFISSGNTSTTATTATIMSDSKSLFSTSSSSGFRTPPPYNHVPHIPTNTKTYSYLKKPPPTQIPINENLNKIETFSFKNDLYDKNKSFPNGFFEKAKIYDEKQQDMKRFIIDDQDDDADSDSSSDLFELTNCDLGYNYSSSGLPVYETTRVDSIKRSAPISS
ncbi:hypothetical protein QVD17_31812 [Tagetes erecta]|uniref:Protein BIG GRAIN 1-like E n=1 Tax=Tagetes erecta TaxID=13708 RepID=A0AAD8K571_TARER|nr:hypothetical protein QVD17_31812 [Tagetes erecta]